MQNQILVKRALISVTDKTGIVEFARTLHKQGIEILSTGGTKEILQKHSIPVREVAEYTDFPEIMGGRVKTLHPKIHGGILGRRDQDRNVMDELGINPIDLVVVNLYPFQETINNPACTLTDAIEQIDIGGPAMIRAAAKNNTFVAVVVDPEDYEQVGLELSKNNNSLSEKTSFALAAKAFTLTSNYDQVVSKYLNQLIPEVRIPSHTKEFPEILDNQFFKKEDLRYGENPHQKAAFYVERHTTAGSLASARLIQGTAASFNNIVDTEAAFVCVRSFPKPACVIVKHANPCGVAVADSVCKAYQLAYATDPTSSYGGIIAFNHDLDADTVRTILAQQFVEVIVAPDISREAQKLLAEKPKIRVFICPITEGPYLHGYDYKRISGGLLVQTPDELNYDEALLEVVTTKQPTEKQRSDLLFAWTVAKYVKSNAIVYARDGATLGIGAGQMSRIDSAKIASLKAQAVNYSLVDGVMASDAFFPFPDSIDLAASIGIKAIIQPGGSIRDAQVIERANELGMIMLFTHIRHFKH